MSKEYVYLVYSSDDGYHRYLCMIFKSENHASAYVEANNKKAQERRAACESVNWNCEKCNKENTDNCVIGEDLNNEWSYKKMEIN